MASNQEWIRGLVDKLILVQRRLRSQRPEPPPSERGLGLTNEALVMALYKVLGDRREREPTTTAKVAFPKLKLQEMRAFSGQLKDYPRWRHDWAQRVEPQYEDVA